MALNPNLILAGQSPDIIGAMDRGNALAANVNQVQDQNALRGLYRTQGADIMAGKQPALNALAGIDPAAALGIQDARLGMDARRLDMSATRQRMDMLSRQEQQQLAEIQANATAAEKQALAAQIEDAVKMGLAIQDPGQWDAVMQTQAPELVGQFANRQALAMKYMSMAEALKASQGPEQPNPVKGAPSGYMWVDPANPAAGVKPLAGYEKTPGVTVNMGGGKFDEEFAKSDAQALATVATAGQTAIRNIPRIEQLDALLSAAPSGMGAALQQAAGEWGINTQGLTEIQAAQAIINSLVPEQRQPGSGPMSDADLALFKQSLPRIINSPGGNQIIIETMRRIAEYDAQGAQIVQDLRSGSIDRAEAFKRLQGRANPLEGIGSVASQGQGAQPSQPNPDEELLRKYGLQP